MERIVDQSKKIGEQIGKQINLVKDLVGAKKPKSQFRKRLTWREKILVLRFGESFSVNYSTEPEKRSLCASAHQSARGLNIEVITRAKDNVLKVTRIA